MRKIEEMLDEEAFAIEKMKERLQNFDTKFWKMLDVKLALIFLLLMYAIGPLFGCSTSPEPTTEAPAPPGKNYTYFCLISREKKQ